MRFSSILLDFVAHLDFKFYQNNVRMTFLNGNIEEEIYTDQRISLISKGHENKVGHLRKSIYGLKQSSRL